MVEVLGRLVATMYQHVAGVGGQLCPRPCPWLGGLRRFLGCRRVTTVMGSHASCASWSRFRACLSQGPSPGNGTPSATGGLVQLCWIGGKHVAALSPLVACVFVPLPSLPSVIGSFWSVSAIL